MLSGSVHATVHAMVATQATSKKCEDDCGGGKDDSTRSTRLENVPEIIPLLVRVGKHAVGPEKQLHTMTSVSRPDNALSVGQACRCRSSVCLVAELTGWMTNSPTD